MSIISIYHIKLNTMKKITTLLLIAFITIPSIISYAGDDDKKKTIRAGWQVSNFYDDDFSTTGTELHAFYVGFNAEKDLVPLLKFGSGIEYLQNGYTGKVLTEEFSYRSHVISIPLYLKLKLGPVFALGGAGMNFNVAQNYKVGGSKIDIPDNLQINVFDVPVFAGVGLKIAMFTIEARYNWGLINAAKSDAFTYKAQYFQLGGGISF